MSSDDPRIYGDWLQTVNEETTKPLTAWETSFMESITDQFERTGQLSARQVEILERIYSEKTA